MAEACSPIPNAGSILSFDIFPRYLPIGIGFGIMVEADADYLRNNHKAPSNEHKFYRRLSLFPPLHTNFDALSNAATKTLMFSEDAGKVAPVDLGNVAIVAAVDGVDVVDDTWPRLGRAGVEVGPVTTAVEGTNIELLPLQFWRGN